MSSASTMTPTEQANIQHVTRKSSDELLKKFADDDEDVGIPKRKELTVSKKRRRTIRTRREIEQSPCVNGALLERRALLAAASSSAAGKRRSLLFRQLRGKDFKNKSFFSALEKTWRRTVEGASRVLLENQYSRHKRLINDVV